MIQSRPVTGRPPYSSRRRALQRRAVPLAAAALVAFVAGVTLGARHQPAEQRAAERYTRAWERSDWTAMYRLLSEGARSRTSLAAFRAAHVRAAQTATATRVRAGAAQGPDGDAVAVPL